MSINSNGSLQYNDDDDNKITIIRDSIILILYLVTAIVAIVGNLFVCDIIIRNKRLTSATYVLIFNMAVSDILGGFVIPAQWLFCSSLVLNSTDWFGICMCGLMKSLQILSYYVSSLTMTAIAYDRYLLVCKPMSSRINVTYMLFIVWMLGLIFISGNLFTLRVTEYFSSTKVRILSGYLLLY